MSSGNTQAFNKNLSQLDYTLFPQSQDALNQFNAMNQETAQRIAGLGSTPTAQAFDTGVGQYEKQAQDLFNNAGYTEQEKQGQRTATEAGFAAPYAAAANEAKLQQQRTGQSAGVGSTLQGLARQRGQQISAGLGGLQQGFGQARIQGQQNALSLSQFPQQARLQRMQQEQGAVGLGLQNQGQQSQLFGTQLQGQLGVAGQRNQYQANNPGFFKTLGQSAASSLGKLI